MNAETVGTRHSVRHLQALYDSGQKKPLEDLVRAWKGIQELPPENPRSFFSLAGYHGEPFQLRAAVDALSPTDIYPYWGGYCNHGNILFPTWHRIFVHRLEQALQSIVPGVMMPFWDESSKDTLDYGIPSILTEEKFSLDGHEIPNPLRSFTMPVQLQDGYSGDNVKGESTPYYKPVGYETVRYPLSGLVGNATDRAATEAHNNQFPEPVLNTALLNQNLQSWINGGETTPSKPDPSGTGVYTLFNECLRAPNYTVFSNTTSASAWNRGSKAASKVVPLEEPHNDIHLAVGGFDSPALGGASNTTGQVPGSNGDMGENNTAAFDPIFFFHHCNIDRVFWLWQKLNGHTESLEVIKKYPGTSSDDEQGPTPGIAPGTELTLESPLNPFVNPTTNKVFTSKDCINTERQLGYTYGPGSLDEGPRVMELERGHSTRKLEVRGIDRALFQGSFVLSAFAIVAEPDGTTSEHYLGHHSVLSRWSVSNCANCRTHLEVIAHFSLRSLTEEQVQRAKFVLKVQHRGKVLPAALRPTLEVLD